MISGTYLYVPGSKTAPTLIYSWKFVLVYTAKEDF